MSFQLSCLPPISKGGGNPFGSLGFFENLKHGMEFEKAKVGNNKLGERRLLRTCSIGKHDMLPPCVVLGFIL